MAKRPCCPLLICSMCHFQAPGLPHLAGAWKQNGSGYDHKNHHNKPGDGN